MRSTLDLSFVIPPSQGNMAGIERTTLLCAKEIGRFNPGYRIRVHMFGDYQLPTEFSELDVVMHDETRIAYIGRALRSWLRPSSGVWVVCQPMTLMALLVWNPRSITRLRPLTVMHGALHVEMSNRRRRFQYALFGKLAKRFHLPVAAVSRELARYAETRLGLPRAYIRTLYNPTLARPRDADEQASKKEYFECVAVGRLHEQKGFDLLIDAFQRSDVDQNARLMIVGEGPQRPLLEDAVKRGARASQIELTGYRNDVLSIIAQASIFVLSSRYEALCGSLIEAVSTGTRVVSTDHQFGAKEILLGGQFGRLVPAYSIDALSTAITSEYEAWKKGRSPNVDRGALNRHLLKFGADAAISNYLKVIRRLPGARAPL